jgi:DNA repair and recombination protein RAD52
MTPEQKAELAKPLDPKHVADRQQGGRAVSYIEAWHAIAEANRIFDFDGWTRETVDICQLGEPYQVAGKDTWRVNYRAKVRIVANGIVREGCGFGQGIDRDVGQAHESALKEAETDAMKRALMTFGNPFGLALYDKTKANVAEAPPPPITDDQLTVLIDHMESLGIAPAALIAAANANLGTSITKVSDLPASEFDAALGWVKSQRKAA